MPDFTPTQYEAREGRDTYMAKATGQGGAVRLQRSGPGERQVELGTHPTLAAANAAKDADVAIRTAAHIHVYLRNLGEKGFRAEVTNYSGFPDVPEKVHQHFPGVGEFEAAYPKLVLHGEGDNGNRIYMTPAAKGRGGR